MSDSITSSGPAVYFAKDLPIPIKGKTGIKAMDLHLDIGRHVKLSDESRHSLLETIGKLKSKDDAFLYLLVDDDLPTNFSIVEFNAVITFGFLKQLAEIPMATFLQIRLKVNHPFNYGTHHATMDGMFNLRDRSFDVAATELLQRLFVLEVPTDSKVTCDIILRFHIPGAPSDATKLVKMNTISEILFNRESTMDLRIAARNGNELKCHGIVLEANSPVLWAMVSRQTGKYGVIEMRDNSEHAISFLIRSFYGLELNTDELTCDLATELIVAARRFQLTDLLYALVEVILKKQGDWFTPDGLVVLYVHVQNLEEFKALQEHLLLQMSRLSHEIRNCSRYQELKQSRMAETANDLIWKLHDLWKTNDKQ